MSSESDTPSDPFADPSMTAEEHNFADDSTLNVGRNASLTLGAESLIVLDEGFREEPRFSCFGLIPTRYKKTRAIPYYNVLWASVSKVEVTIQYAKPTSKTDVSVAYVNYYLDQSQSDTTESAKIWIEKLLDRAYGTAQRNKRLKVLINPVGGQGKASKMFTKDIEPIFAAARCDMDVETTKYSGHGTDIAKEIDINAYDVVACCSGDGLPYEVFNGLGKRENATEALSKLAVVNLPCGSGNAMCWNLNGTGSPSMAALCIVKGLRMPLDLVSVTQGDRRYLSFLSQAIGIVADTDLGTEHLRWMGPARFTVGFLLRLLGKTTYPCDIAVKVGIDDKPSIKSHYDSVISSSKSPSEIESSLPLRQATTSGLPRLTDGTTSDEVPTSSGWAPLTPFPTLGNFYAGNMCIMTADSPFFPLALPSDGYLDLVRIDGNIPRTTAFTAMLAVEQGTLFSQEYVRYQKVSGYRVVPKFDKGFIAIDGEAIPFEPFQAEVHRGLGTVLSKSGRLYESEGPKDPSKRG